MRELDVVHQHALGDLEHDRLGFDAGAGDDGLRGPRPNLGWPSWRPERLTETLTSESVGCGASPVGEVAARGLEHRTTDRHDEPGLLGDRDELRREQQTPFGMPPPHQGLEVAYPSGGQVEDRLVEHLQARRLERSAQRGLDVEPATRSATAGVSSNTRHLSAPTLLGAVHGGIGVAEQHLGGDFLVGGRRLRVAWKNAMPTLAADVHLGVVDREHVLEDSLDAFGRFDGVRFVVEILAEDDELVAAESGHRVVGPQAHASVDWRSVRAADRPTCDRGCR